MFHIIFGTLSPYVSLTTSYGVARDYAINASRTRPTSSHPGYVYAVDINASDGILLFDPVREVIAHCGNPLASPSYNHDGAQSYLLGVVDPVTMGTHLHIPAPQPLSASGATPRSPTLTAELETMVRALRDAEVLAGATIPARCFVQRFDEY